MYFVNESLYEPKQIIVNQLNYYSYEFFNLKAGDPMYSNHYTFQSWSKTNKQGGFDDTIRNY